MQLELPFDASTYVERPGGRDVSPRRRRVPSDGQQFVLPGCGIRQLENLFFCLRPPTAAAALAKDRARSVVDEHGLCGILRREKLYHVTQHGIGTYDTVPPALSNRAIEVARTIRMAPFDVHFDRIISFANKDNNNPLVLLAGGDLSALWEFYGLLGDGLRNAGFKRIQRSFTPHMTLLYDSRLVPETPIAPIGWTVRNFVLVHSPIGKSRHKKIASFELAG